MSGARDPSSPLPRFELPHEPVADPTEIASLSDMPELEKVRKIVRVRRPSPPPMAAVLPPVHAPIRSSADETQDVAVEDVLLEVYVTPPPRSVPPSRRTTPPPLPVAIPKATETAPLPALADSIPPPSSPPASLAPLAVSQHPPSVEFAFPPSVPPYERPPSFAAITPPDRLGPSLVARVAIAAAVVGVLVSAAALGMRAGSSGPASGTASPPAPSTRLVASQKTAIDRTSRAIVTASIDALPKEQIAEDATMVTFASGAGHRVFVDGVVLHPGADPIKLHCGKRTMKVGSAGKPRELDLPCGASFTVK